MSRPAPTSRFRDRISGPLIRILGLYVALVTGFVMALIVTAIYLYQSSRLDYVREKVLTRVVAEVINQAGELDALATSPLLWTGLTDSKGREVYLAPLIERFNRGPLRQLYVLDYGGRVFIAPQSQPATVTAAIAADPIVTASVTASREG
ncbi:MAG: hypothetical protein RL513_1300, partial [Pseudomonadota bacterium]